MYRMIVLAMFFFATSAWAQESTPADEAETETTAEAEETATAEDIEVPDNPTDYLEGDDDVFKPTDVVSYQQSVPFPTDI